MTDATSRAGTVYPSGALEFIPYFTGFRVARSLVFLVRFCGSLFVPLSIVLSVLRFADSDYLPLVSSNSCSIIQLTWFHLFLLFSGKTSYDIILISGTVVSNGNWNIILITCTISMLASLLSMY